MGAEGSGHIKAAHVFHAKTNQVHHVFHHSHGRRLGADELVDIALVKIETLGVFDGVFHIFFGSCVAHGELFKSGNPKLLFFILVSALFRPNFRFLKSPPQINPAIQIKLCQQIHDTGAADALRLCLTDYMCLQPSVFRGYAIHRAVLRPHTGTDRTALQGRACRACACQQEFLIAHHQFAVGSHIQEDTDLLPVGKPRSQHTADDIAAQVILHGRTKVYKALYRNSKLRSPAYLRLQSLYRVGRLKNPESIQTQ